MANDEFPYTQGLLAYSVHELTRFLSKLSDEKARVIFAGMRLGDLTDRIRAMARADNIDANIYAEIDRCLTQLDIIADARNKLVHRSVHFFDGKFIVSNSMTAKTTKGLEFHTFSRTELKAMRSDCGSIFLRLLEIVRPSDPKADDRIPGLPSFIEYLNRPWRYIPAPPNTPKKPRHKSAESLKPRPPSSRERREAAMGKKK